MFLFYVVFGHAGFACAVGPASWPMSCSWLRSGFLSARSASGLLGARREPRGCGDGERNGTPCLRPWAAAGWRSTAIAYGSRSDDVPARACGGRGLRSRPRQSEAGRSAIRTFGMRRITHLTLPSPPMKNGRRGSGPVSALRHAASSGCLNQAAEAPH